MHGVGPVELVWTLGVAVFSIAPLVLALLAVKWLYESKKSLAEILRFPQRGEGADRCGETFDGE